jgi:hypothetical protein
MPAINFKKEFVDAVKDGSKAQTIRATRKVPIKVGDILYLYTGMRTKQCEKIGEVVCKSVHDIEINDIGIMVDGSYLNPSECYRLAIADGFENTQAFLKFFKPPFKGQLIKW